MSDLDDQLKALVEKHKSQPKKPKDDIDAQLGELKAREERGGRNPTIAENVGYLASRAANTGTLGLAGAAGRGLGRGFDWLSDFVDEDFFDYDRDVRGWMQRNDADLGTHWKLGADLAGGVGGALAGGPAALAVRGAKAAAAAGRPLLGMAGAGAAGAVGTEAGAGNIDDDILSPSTMGEIAVTGALGAGGGILGEKLMPAAAGLYRRAKGVLNRNPNAGARGDAAADLFARNAAGESAIEQATGSAVGSIDEDILTSAAQGARVSGRTPAEELQRLMPDTPDGLPDTNITDWIARGTNRRTADMADERAAQIARDLPGEAVDSTRSAANTRGADIFGRSSVTPQEMQTALDDVRAARNPELETILGSTITPQRSGAVPDSFSVSLIADINTLRDFAPVMNIEGMEELPSFLLADLERKMRGGLSYQTLSQFRKTLSNLPQRAMEDGIYGQKVDSDNASALYAAIKPLKDKVTAEIDRAKEGILPEGRNYSDVMGELGAGRRAQEQYLKIGREGIKNTSELIQQFHDAARRAGTDSARAAADQNHIMRGYFGGMMEKYKTPEALATAFTSPEHDAVIRNMIPTSAKASDVIREFQQILRSRQFEQALRKGAKEARQAVGRGTQGPIGVAGEVLKSQGTGAVYGTGMLMGSLDRAIARAARNQKTALSDGLEDALRTPGRAGAEALEDILSITVRPSGTDTRVGVGVGATTGADQDPPPR